MVRLGGGVGRPIRPAEPTPGTSAGRVGRPDHRTLTGWWSGRPVGRPELGALTPCHNSSWSNFRQGTVFTRAAKVDHFLQKLFKYLTRCARAVPKFPLGRGGSKAPRFVAPATQAPVQRRDPGLYIASDVVPRRACAAPQIKAAIDEGRKLRKEKESQELDEHRRQIDERKGLSAYNRLQLRNTHAQQMARIADRRVAEREAVCL